MINKRVLESAWFEAQIARLTPETSYEALLAACTAESTKFVEKKSKLPFPAKEDLFSTKREDAITKATVDIAYAEFVRKVTRDLALEEEKAEKEQKKLSGVQSRALKVDPWQLWKKAVAQTMEEIRVEKVKSQTEKSFKDDYVEMYHTMPNPDAEDAVVTQQRNNMIGDCISSSKNGVAQSPKAERKRPKKPKKPGKGNDPDAENKGKGEDKGKGKTDQPKGKGKGKDKGKAQDKGKGKGKSGGNPKGSGKNGKGEKSGAKAKGNGKFGKWQ